MKEKQTKWNETRKRKGEQGDKERGREEEKVKEKCVNYMHTSVINQWKRKKKMIDVLVGMLARANVTNMKNE